MSDYRDMTALELAACLDMAASGPPNTGALSMLDEATLEFGWRYESVSPAQRAMAEARHAHMGSYQRECGDYAPEAWLAAAQACRDLAAALRPLGETFIPRCKRQGPCGTCNMGLDASGECHSSLGHTDKCPAGECNGYGEVIVDGCTCGAGPGGYYGIHERGCGSEPCPAGCEYVPPGQREITRTENER